MTLFGCACEKGHTCDVCHDPDECECDQCEKARGPYEVCRFFFKGSPEVLKSGLTLSEAQAHCSDPETSWKTATSKEATQRTEERGEWFEGYRRE